MKISKIEKRIPFGFRGDWGTLYKKFDYDEKTDNETVLYNQIKFVDFGMDVQFKRIDDEKIIKSVFSVNSLAKLGDLIVETTDAYWNDELKRFQCVVEAGDIVKVFNRYFVVQSVKTHSVYTPAEQQFFYIELKNLTKEEVHAAE